MRPHSDDQRILGELLDSDKLGTSGQSARILLLGVTPEIAVSPHLHNAYIIAAEKSQSMIDAIWPGNGVARAAVCADWSDLPVPDHSMSLVIGDGCLSVVGAIDELPRVLAETNRCLRHNGHLLLRLFCQPAQPETPEDVVVALRAGQIGSFHAFKWRLAMAIQASRQAMDVPVTDVWRVWRDTGLTARQLAAEHHWPLVQIETINLYRDSPAHYNFMSFDTTMAKLRDAGFELLARREGHYELANCCPHILLKKSLPTCQ
jgi:SAM-dependent methyltransferase